MQRQIYFPQFCGSFWPSSDALSNYFLTPEGTDQTFSGGNDGWSLSIAGLYGTEHLIRYTEDPRNPEGTAVEAHLTAWFNPQLGVLLGYSKFGGGYGEHYFSVGDLSQLTLWVYTLHGDLRPIGLFIPHSKAWTAVKEFMDREGELPNAIEWIASRDLPANTFPDPQAKVPTIETAGYPWDRDPNWWDKNTPAV